MKIEIHDIPVAFSLLTRLPVVVDHERAGLRGAQAAWAYPLVGLVLGLIAGGVGWGLMAAGVNAGVVAVFVIATQVVLTGALHEDGLADMADGMGGFTRERRLEIMKDSRIGAYGAIALVLALLVRHAGLASLTGAELPLALAALGAGSRSLMVALMAGLPNARPGGLSAAAGKPPFSAVMVALGVGIGSSLIAFGWFGMVVFLLMAMAALAVALLAKNRFGGQTGDVLGATQQASEIIGLAVL